MQGRRSHRRCHRSVHLARNPRARRAVHPPKSRKEGMDSGAPRRRRLGSLVHRRTRFGSGDTTGVWILMPPIDPDPKIRRNLKLFQEFGWTRPEPWASITHWGKHRIVPQLQSPHGEYRASVSSDDIMFWGPSSDFPLFIITIDTQEPPPPHLG